MQSLLVRDLETNISHLDFFDTEIKSLESSIKAISHIHSATHHEIIVPLGRKAFMPGTLNNTNCFKVSLGCGYFVDSTASQATEILQRRKHKLVKSREKLLSDLKNRCAEIDGTPGSIQEPILEETPEGYIEIKEPIEALDEKESATVTKSDLPPTNAVKSMVIERGRPSEPKVLETQHCSSKPPRVSRFKQQRLQLHQK
ncbi:hypothetical protein P9112_012952 [Eukaryota sp. TZLM1-RC]